MEQRRATMTNWWQACGFGRLGRLGWPDLSGEGGKGVRTCIAVTSCYRGVLRLRPTGMSRCRELGPDDGGSE
jgi:hypothetical protein